MIYHPNSVNPDDHKFWRNEKGQLHREDGPAIEWCDGSKEWYINGIQHRVDGPAMEKTHGYKIWIFNGQYHRDDGPAIEYISGYRAWYYHGKEIDCSCKEEFEKIIKLRMFW